MSSFKTRDGQFEIEIEETDIVAATSLDAPEPPVVDFITIKVKSPDTEKFRLDLDFDPQVAIDLGKEIARQGRSAKND